MTKPVAFPVVEFKALPAQDGQETGEFSAIVSTFGNVDLVGDRVMPGAFSKSLEKWRTSGDPIPVVYMHMWSDVFAHIGEADPHKSEELEPGDPRLPEKIRGNGGLKVEGRYDVNDNPTAAQVYRLQKARRIKDWSFSYDVVDEREGEDGARNLHELDIIEIGPALKGTNDLTTTVGLKSADTGEWKCIACGSRLNAAGDGERGTGKVEDPKKGKTEDPDPYLAIVRAEIEALAS